MISKRLLKKNVFLTEKTLLKKACLSSKLSQKAFGSAHHHESSGFDSGSESHHHDHHHESFYKDKKITTPWNTFRHVKSEKFDVLGLIEKLREPVQQPSKNHEMVKPEKETRPSHEIEKEYISFLADTFKTHVSAKYPNYRDEVERLSEGIPNFSKLNDYEKEVQLLDAYMQDSLKQKRESSYTKQNLKASNNSSPFSSSHLEELQYRIDLLGKLTTVNENDSRVLKNIKKKLKKVLESDSKYSRYLKQYNEEIENNVVQKIVERTQKGYLEQKDIRNRELHNTKSPLNPYYHPVSVTPHDDIKIDDWNKDPEKIDNLRHKYLAHYDIVLDQHLRRVRPENLDDDIFKYSNPNKNDYLDNSNDITDNTVFDHVCRLDGEYYNNFKNEIEKFINQKNVEDPVSRFFHL